MGKSNKEKPPFEKWIEDRPRVFFLRLGGKI